MKKTIMNKEDAQDIQNISAMLVDTLVSNPHNKGALHLAAALGVTLAALATNANEQNDLVFAFGLDTAMSIYEKQRERAQ